MRPEWERKPFSAICEHSAFGPRFSGDLYSTNGNVATLRTTDIAEDGRIEYGSMPLASIDLSRFRQHVLQVGDLVVTRSGRVGTAAVFCGSQLPVLPGAFLIRFRLRREVADPHFYGYFFNSREGRDLVISTATGSVQQNLNITSLHRLVIPVPPLETQRRIAGVLGALDDKIELNRRMNETLAALVRALFAEMIERQPSKRFSELVAVVGGGTPKTAETSYWGGGIPWFSVIDTPRRDDIFVIETQRTLTKEGLASCSAELLPVGTTIITARGTVGNLALLGAPMAINQSCYGLAPVEPYGPYFVYLSTERLVEKLLQRTHGSVFETITRRTFEGLETPVPPHSRLMRFERDMGPYFARIVHGLRESRTLAELRDALLPKLISGELRVRDAEAAIEAGAEPKQT